MKYAEFSSKQTATDFLRSVQAKGMRGYLLTMRSDFHEVRYWA